ncbi:MAG: hypothetical protein AAFT19_05960 [Pseudomonadota bacterium]
MTDEQITEIDYRRYEEKAHALRAEATREMIAGLGDALRAFVQWLIMAAPAGRRTA